MTSLQNLLDETEKRTDEVKHAKEGIVAIEARLQRLSKELNDKFDLLEKVAQAENDADSSDSYRNPSLTPRDKEDIRKLWKQGWSKEVIARRLNRSIGEVELVIEMDS